MKTKFELLFLLLNIQILFTATIIYCAIQTNSNGFTTVPRTEPELAAYRQFIANLTKDYWNNYFQEFTNLSSQFQPERIYELLSTLPSLHLMGQKEGFEQARQWIATHFNTSEFTCNPEISSPEKCNATALLGIKTIGRLLACHSLSNDKLFLDKAKEMIEMFNVTIFTDFKNKSEYTKAEVFVNLALSFRYLTAITGDVRYENILHQYSAQFHTGLPNVDKIQMSLDWDAKIFHTQTALYSMKADTLGETYANQLFTDLEWVLAVWHFKTSNDSAKLRYLTRNLDSDFIELKHTQFSTVFALAAQLSPKVFSLNETSLKLTQRMLKWWELAKSIEKTVSTIVNRSAIKLPTLDLVVEDNPSSFDSKIHTPSTEVAEMYFVFWQLTGEEIYREKAWQMMQSMHKYSYDAEKKQFYTLRIIRFSDNFYEQKDMINVLSDGTLSYLYLIFSDKDTYSLDRVVFDTHGSPWPIYRKTCTFTKA